MKSQKIHQSKIAAKYQGIQSTYSNQQFFYILGTNTLIKIMDTLPFAVVPKTIKYLGGNKNAESPV